jgi:hypothetical protein
MEGSCRDRDWDRSGRSNLFKFQVALMPETPFPRKPLSPCRKSAWPGRRRSVCFQRHGQKGVDQPRAMPTSRTTSMARARLWVCTTMM